MKQTTLLFTNRKRLALLTAVLTFFITLFTAQRFNEGWGIRFQAAVLTFITLFTAGGTKESMESMKKKAGSGNAQAQFDLAMIYYEGEGAPADDIESIKGALGLNYALAGESVGKDYVEAAKWFQKAAEQGLAQAQYMLGAMYAVGDGVPKNDIEAVKWTRKAAEQGHADAQNNLNIEEAMRTRKAAEQGESKSQFHFGLIYAEGVGVRKGNIEAVMGARKAAEQGYAYAQFHFGWMYFSGEGVTKNNIEAVKWFQKAAEQGHAKAQNNLGVMYAKGEGVTKNYIESVMWIRKAAEQMFDTAQYNLGMLYYKGEGVSKDAVGAYAWFLLAKSRGCERADRVIKILEERLTAEQRAEGQARAAELDRTIRVTMDNIETYAWLLFAKIRGVEGTDRNIEIWENLLTAEQRAEGQARAAELDRRTPRE